MLLPFKKEGLTIRTDKFLPLVKRDGGDFSMNYNDTTP